MSNASSPPTKTAPPRPAAGQKGKAAPPADGKGRKGKEKKEGSQIAAAPLEVNNSQGEATIKLDASQVSRYRQWHTRLSRTFELKGILGLTSAVRGEGVSTAALGLTAVIASDLGKRVCLVEMNWYWPSLAVAMKVEPNPGLVQWAKLNDQSALRSTGMENLWIIPSGDLPDVERPGFAHSSVLSEAVDRLRQQFDLLVLDIPAVLAVSDCQPLLALADSLCFVLRQGATPMPLFRQALDEVEHLPVAGVVFNGDHIAMPAFLYRLIAGE